MSGVRCTVICLERRPDRRIACEAHLRRVLPPAVLDTLDFYPAVDGKAAAGQPPSVDAIEKSTDCRLYRGWPILDSDDVRRCYPRLCELGDVSAWVAYEKSFAAWQRDRARLYVDFFCRHLTCGDVGAALSHFRVAQRAAAEGVALQVILEDDAALTADALPRLLREVELLRAAGVAWDLIYLMSSKYDRVPEPEVGVPGSLLRVASHRKVSTGRRHRCVAVLCMTTIACHQVHMAYALSAAGAAKLASSGFDGALLAYDDWLPSLHSTHPRDDVMGLESVRCTALHSAALRCAALCCAVLCDAT